MIFDFDKANTAVLDKVLPWEFVFRAGGVDYQTRPPTVADLITLLGKLQVGMAIQTLQSLFVGDKRPPVETWTTEQLQIALTAFGTAFGDHVAKNSPAIAQATAQAMGKTQTPQKPGN